MRVLAVCAGIGGLELGIQRACPEARLVGVVERNAFCAATLVARMAEASLDPAPIWDDVSTFDAAAWRGCVDLVAAGFPCQDISIAGSGDGLDGERSRLWWEVHRVVRDVGAGWLFVENAAALIARGLDRVLGSLAEIGFDAEWTVLRADDLRVGARHRRARCFLLARHVSHADRCPLRIGPERGAGPAREAGDAGDPELGPVGPDRALPDPDRGRCPGEREPDGPGLEGAPGDQPVGRGEDGVWWAPLPYAGLAGLEGPEREALLRARWRDQRRAAAELRVPSPPAPDDPAGWERWIAEGGGPAAVAGLGRGPDGAALGLEFTGDRLEALGNAVHPVQAEVALRLLRARFGP